MISPLETGKENFYYIQDKSRGVDNSMVWWMQGNHGYSRDLKKARVWTVAEMDRECKDAGDLRAWPKEYIDIHIQHHIDITDIDFDPKDALFIDY